MGRRLRTALTHGRQKNRFAITPREIAERSGAKGNDASISNLNAAAGYGAHELDEYAVLSLVHGVQR